MVLSVGLGVLDDRLVDCMSVLDAVSCIHFKLSFTRAGENLLHRFPEENVAFLDFDVELLESVSAGPQVACVRVIECPQRDLGRAMLGHQSRCLAEVCVSHLLALLLPDFANQLSLIVELVH